MRCASAFVPAVFEVYILHARASMLHMACACEYDPWSERCWRLCARPLQLLASLFCVCVYVLFTLIGIVEWSNLSMRPCPLWLALRSSYLIHSHGRRHCDIYIYTCTQDGCLVYVCVNSLCWYSPKLHMPTFSHCGINGLVCETCSSSSGLIKYEFSGIE